MALGMTITRELNYMKRCLAGSIGTTSVSGRLSTKDLTTREAKYIARLIKRSGQINVLLKAQIEDIEVLYLKHGSKRTRELIAQRRELRRRYKEGEKLTDEEFNILFETRSHGRIHKGPKNALKTLQSIFNPLCS